MPTQADDLKTILSNAPLLVIPIVAVLGTALRVVWWLADVAERNKWVRWTILVLVYVGSLTWAYFWMEPHWAGIPTVLGTFAVIEIERRVERWAHSLSSGLQEMRQDLQALRAELNLLRTDFDFVFGPQAPESRSAMVAEVEAIERARQIAEQEKRRGSVIANPEEK